MLPYLVTIIVLVAVSMRKKRENEPPAALGLAYFREERSFQSSTVFAVELCYYALLAATGVFGVSSRHRQKKGGQNFMLSEYLCRKEVKNMLSENLKTLRRQKGFTQEELAARLNVVRQTVSKWEKGVSRG